MKNTKFYLFFLFIFICSCADDSSVVPSLKLDYFSAQVQQGKLLSVVSDEKQVYKVEGTSPSFDFKEATGEVRIVAYYEQLSSDAVQLYSLSPTFTHEPIPYTQYEQIVTMPVNVLSATKGYRYLNINLEFYGKDIPHRLNFIEESVVDSGDRRTVSLLLYHDTKGDILAFPQRSYVSVPLAKYNQDFEGKEILVKFKYYSYLPSDKGGKYLETKYATPGFLFKASDFD